jgi:hypothetical protein
MTAGESYGHQEEKPHILFPQSYPEGKVQARRQVKQNHEQGNGQKESE